MEQNYLSLFRKDNDTKNPARGYPTGHFISNVFTYS